MLLLHRKKANSYVYAAKLNYFRGIYIILNLKNRRWSDNF